jgi:hypothetical protein
MLSKSPEASFGELAAVEIARRRREEVLRKTKIDQNLLPRLLRECEAI